MFELSFRTPKLQSIFRNSHPKVIFHVSPNNLTNIKHGNKSSNFLNRRQEGEIAHPSHQMFAQMEISI